MARLFTRAIRPPDDITPNPNDPGSVPPATVGPDQLVRPGDPHGVLVDPTEPQYSPPPPRVTASAWSGWPADWWTPNWGVGTNLQQLTDTAWLCVDINANLLSTMPPYLVNAASGLDAGWMANPDPDLYTSWEEFAKQLFWDFMLGEAFVISTARYATGWPARFHVVPPWMVNVEMDAGRRLYTIGSVDVSGDILHLRYTSNVSDAHGHGPLEAGAGRLVAAQLLARYATGIAGSGGIPSSILEHPETLDAEQANLLRSQWVTARLSALGEPAVLSGGVTWKPTQLNPRDMALLELAQWNESHIALMLGVPPHLLSLPTGDPMTYANATSYFDYHWRAFLRPRAQLLMPGLSWWLLPRGTRVEVNRDAYIQPEPLQRAQTAQILNGIVDPITGQPALSVGEIRQAERLDDTEPDLGTGVLRG